MQQTIHIVDRFDFGLTGSALDALALASLLRDHADVRIWSEAAPIHASHAGRFIHSITGTNWPIGGTLIIVGGYFSIGPWLEHAKPQRLIIKYNAPYHIRLFQLLHRCHCANLPAPELVFVSHLLRNITALPGRVEPSWIDLELFSPKRPLPDHAFIIGRLSRDDLTKHHEDDPSLYRLAAEAGWRIRVMGGECLKPYLGENTAGIELLPAGAEPAHEFLHSLDVFFFRYHPSITETFGRTVLEAMACGLPVVCEPRGGYTELIRHGENGVLVNNQEDALFWLEKLATDIGLRKRLGTAARRTTEKIYSQEAQCHFRNYYLAQE